MSRRFQFSLKTLFVATALLAAIVSFWRRSGKQPVAAGMTETGYTSWTTNRSLAEDAARAGTEELSGQIRVFRVRIDTLNPKQLYEGRADEDEWLIAGTVENVEFCESGMEDEENA